MRAAAPLGETRANLFFKTQPGDGPAFAPRPPDEKQFVADPIDAARRSGLQAPVDDLILFGRHWGAIEHHPFLHFVICYYQAIDFAIERKLKRVEAGAQGEPKPAPGHLPAPTHSAPYIADPGLPPGAPE